MELNNKNICFIAAYAAPYGGNFIKMLQALATRLVSDYNCTVYFIFPTQDNKEWLNELSIYYTIGFTSSFEASDEILTFIDNWDIDLVHSHFEAYDIAVSKAIKHSGRNIKQVWHIHDYMHLDKTELSFPRIRKFFTNQFMWNHYGKWGENAFFIAVSDEMAHFVNHYRTHRFMYPTEFTRQMPEHTNLIRTASMLNGMDTSRIASATERRVKPNVFTFLTFGGESVSKGIPTIFDACELLSHKGTLFKLILTKGYTTTSVLQNRYGDHLPKWLELVEQTNEVSTLFSRAHCYISASLRETMSMAIAEASLFGLPVIQSDIPGTTWNANNPSTFLFPVNDKLALCNTMTQVIHLTQSGEMEHLVKKTQHHNQSILEMDKWVTQIISIYNNITASS